MPAASPPPSNPSSPPPATGDAPDAAVDATATAAAAAAAKAASAHRALRRAAWRAWFVASLSAFLLVIVPAASLLLILGRQPAAQRLIWDETYMVPIIQAIVSGPDAWSTSTLLDFDDTKGPAFFVIYAITAATAGGTGPGPDPDHSGASLNLLRGVSVLAFAIAWWPLAAIARRATLGRPDAAPSRATLGAGPIASSAAPGRAPNVSLRPGPMLALAVLLVALPYHAATAGLVMSEVTFTLGMLLLAWVVLSGLDAEERAAGQTPLDPRRWRFAAPLAFALLLGVFLHHRIHAVVWGGASVLLISRRLGLRAAWPWWFALVLAGLCRLPLAFRWGGLVGPGFQDRYGLGLSPAAVVYLIIALLPFSALPSLWLLMQRSSQASGDVREQWRRRMAMRIMLIAGIVGLVAGLLFTPDLQEVIDDVPHVLGPSATMLQALGGGLDRGLAALGASALDGERLVIALFAGLGLSALLGLIGAVVHRSPLEAAAASPMALLFTPGRGTRAAMRGTTSADRSRATAWLGQMPAAVELALLVVLVGLGLSGLSAGAVYERYLLAFTPLLPVVMLWLWWAPTPTGARGPSRGGSVWLTAQMLLWLAMSTTLVWRWLVDLGG